jgi:probable HAF family extracellular repeat protein
VWCFVCKIGLNAHFVHFLSTETGLPMRKNRSITAMVALPLMLACAGAHAASSYQMAPITPASTQSANGESLINWSYTNLINATGQTAGTVTANGKVAFLPATVGADGVVVSHSVTSGTQAYLADENGVKTLGTLGRSTSYAAAINNQGQVVGTAQNEVFNTTSTLSLGGQSWTTVSDARAFLYSNGQMHDLGTLGGSTSSATAINNKGVVLGQSTTAGDQQVKMFTYSQGTMTALNTAAGAVGAAINDQGQVTGELNGQAFLYQNGQLTSLGKGGGLMSQGVALSSAGQVTGNVMFEGGLYQAFLYDQGTFTLLGGLPALNNITFSEARSVNNQGNVVGSSLFGSYEQHGFLYRDGQMIDLNTLVDSSIANNVTLTDALSIDDTGAIVAFGSNGLRYRLTPTTAVPEPQSLILMGLGLAAMAAWRRRRT